MATFDVPGMKHLRAGSAAQTSPWCQKHQKWVEEDVRIVPNTVASGPFYVCLSCFREEVSTIYFEKLVQ